MSGHSKWSQIKRQKAAADQKRGNLFTKLANAITIAAKQGGDTDMNFKLRLAIDKAKQANMPNDTIERAVQKGTGELAGDTIEEVVYEGYGPSGIAFLIIAATDNKNRTTATVRKHLTGAGGNLGTNGSVTWLFSQKGVIRIPRTVVRDKDALELALIDAGADDIADAEEGLTVYTRPQQFAAVRSALDQYGIEPASAEIEFVPRDTVQIQDPKIQNAFTKLCESLEAEDDITNYFTNAEIQI